MSYEQDWYSPLKTEEPVSKETKENKRRPRFFVIGGLLLLVALIVGSSLLFSAPEQDRAYTERNPGWMDDGILPEDKDDFFSRLYDTVIGETKEINLPRAALYPDFSVKTEAAPETELSMREIYEQCSPSIVSVTGYEDGLDGYYWGTGIVLSEDGLILTNAHIIEGCDRAEVSLGDEKSYEARLVGADSLADIAVLKIDAKGLKPAKFGDSAELSVGDRVAAIGNPLSDTLRSTMTDGIISAIDRGISYNGHSMTLLQTDAAINEGNSGGALFNMYGQVIGVTNMKMMSSFSSIEGIGFAIPSATVKSVVDSLVTYGELRGRPSIGITVGAIPPEAKERYKLPDGLYVSKVEEDCDAAAKGIEIGDVIISANGQPVNSTDDLLAIKNTLSVGDSIRFEVWRDGESFTVDVELMETNDIY